MKNIFLSETLKYRECAIFVAFKITSTSISLANNQKFEFLSHIKM